MALQRITELSEPPVVGQRYLVPTVLYVWAPGMRRGENRYGAEKVHRHWPVLGPKHNDKDFLHFPHDHYHVDPRFLSAADWKRVERYARYRLDNTPIAVIEGVPLAYTPHYAERPDGTWGHVLMEHPPIEWRAMKCMRDLHRPRRVGELAARLEPHYAGKVCKRGKAGFICPHRQFPLGTVEAVDGVITCPLHGLRIDAETGVVLDRQFPLTLAPTP